MARTRRKHNAPKGSTREKGDILEKIIAEMHDMPGVKVERNVFLPSIDKSGRTREIDVLITSQVAGFQVRIAIECKNEKKNTDIERIDAFIGKLQDIGIPVQHGIFVSASRYASGAIEHGKSVGIRTFLLKDVTGNLSDQVNDAFQSLLQLLATIATVKMSIAEDNPQPPGLSMFFYNDEGKIIGSIGDLVWKFWQENKIPVSLGIHEVEINLPSNWIQKYEGKELTFTKITVKVLVTGHNFTVRGSLKRHDLIDATNNIVDKWQIKATFPSPIGTHNVIEFHTEEDLEKYLTSKPGISLLSGRYKLPRIRWASFYWPPSKKALAKFQFAVDESISLGKELDWMTFPFDEIEGTDLSEAYEPIWEGHPYEKINNPNKQEDTKT